MVAFFNMIVTEGNNNFTLMNDNRYKGSFPGVQVFQRDSNIWISFSGNKFNGFGISVDQAVKAFNMGAVAVFTGAYLSEDGGTGNHLRTDNRIKAEIVQNIRIRHTAVLCNNFRNT